MFLMHVFYYELHEKCFKSCFVCAKGNIFFISVQLFYLILQNHKLWSKPRKQREWDTHSGFFFMWPKLVTLRNSFEQYCDTGVKK